MLFELFELSQIGLPLFQIRACVENHVHDGARDHDAFENSDSAVHRSENEEPERQCTHVESDSQQLFLLNLFCTDLKRAILRSFQRVLFWTKTVSILEAASTIWTSRSSTTFVLAFSVEILTKREWPQSCEGATRLYLYFITYQRAHGRLMIQWHPCQTSV